jgi:toxin CcdB
VARFDVYKSAKGEYLVDCQADLLSHLDTRFVVPLIPPDAGLKVVTRLNPTFMIDGQQLIFFTQYASAISIRALSKKVGSLADQDSAILAALDMLIIGY